MGYGAAANTHATYRTINHRHLDGFVNWAMKDFPDAGLNPVECEDGRWFVEVDHGTRFNGIAGVSCPNVAPYVEPQFHASEQAALSFALACIKLAHPELVDRDLDECFIEYERD